MPLVRAVSKSVWFMGSLDPYSCINAHAVTETNAKMLFSTRWCQLPRENTSSTGSEQLELLSGYARTDIKHTQSCSNLRSIKTFSCLQYPYKTVFFQGDFLGTWEIKALD